MYQRLYSDWHIGRAWNHIKPVFWDTVKTWRDHYFCIPWNPEWLWYKALRNGGCTYPLPSVLQRKGSHSLLFNPNQGSFIINSGSRISYPREFCHPVPRPQDLPNFLFGAIENFSDLVLWLMMSFFLVSFAFPTLLLISIQPPDLRGRNLINWIWDSYLDY